MFFFIAVKKNPIIQKIVAKRGPNERHLCPIMSMKLPEQTLV